MSEVEETSAGGVLYRRLPSGSVEILLGEQRDRITRDWTIRLPKGHLEPGESVEEAALREVREETGRRAHLGDRLDEVRYRYFDPSRPGHITKRVVFYLMEDAGESDEPRDEELERVSWCPLDEASGRLSFEPERAVVRRAARLLDP